MRLYKRRKANGEYVWWASWTEEGVTVRRSTRCATKAAAELVAARWERERADPVYAAANEATLGGEYLVFIAECKQAVARGSMAEETVAMYRQKAANLMDLIGKDTRLAAIDATMILDYVEKRLTEPGARRGSTVGESTVYKEWVCLRQILKSARHRGRFHRDPASLKPPRLTNKYVPRERWLTPCEIMALLEALGPRRAAPVAYVLATGGRRKEWWSAKGGDIVAGIARLHGTKTDASDRRIPVPSVFTPLLDRALLHGPPFAPWGNSRRDIIAACDRAGIEPCTWNDLRRTCASLLIWHLGVAPHVVARLLGHTTTAMVDKVYGKTTAESLGDLMERQMGAVPRTTGEPDKSQS